MQTFSFTRQFVGGHLIGLTHDDTISFPSYGDFRHWVDRVNDNPELNYQVIWAEGDEITAQTPVEVY